MRAAVHVWRSPAAALLIACTGAGTPTSDGSPPPGGSPRGGAVIEDGIEYTGEVLVMESFPVQLSGRVTIANAPGTGIGDDKAIYSFMPGIVEFYTGEKPILANVDTWRCADRDSLKYVLDHLPELVVKEVHGSGGYGMLIGPSADKTQIANFRTKLKLNPRNFIAQPTLALSTCPTCVDAGIAPRHVDLRPFVLTGRDKIRIVPGGLTRVALKAGSLVVNSSQGGGTKDTWVLDR